MGEIYEPTEEYFPTMIVGSCSKCKMVAQLEIPMDGEFLRKGDAAMNRQPVPAWCPKCKKMVEFIPSDPSAVDVHEGHRIVQGAEKNELRERGIIKP